MLFLFGLSFTKIFRFISEELRKLFPSNNLFMIILSIIILIYIRVIFILNLHIVELFVFYVGPKILSSLINVLKINELYLGYHPLYY
jgi:hypothetical protein